jgi:hypothetical protein
MAGRLIQKKNQFSFFLLTFDKTTVILSNRIRDGPSDDVNGTRVRIGDSRAKKRPFDRQIRGNVLLH